MQVDSQRRDHFTDLDGMRGILACLVMLMHYGSDRITAILTHGFLERCEWDLSVDFFFVLSGFVLARSFQHRALTWEQYFAKRLFRLAPMFFIALILIVICGIPLDTKTLIANLLIVQSIVGLASLNIPSWSIPFELFLPVLGLPAVSRWNDWNKLVIVALFAVFLFGAMLSAYFLAGGSDHRLARALTGLGLGFLLYRLGAHRLVENRGSSLFIVVAFLAILVVMLVSHRFPLASLAFHPFVAAAVLAGATARSIFSSPPCQALGRWSYSLYLLHVPVLKMTERNLGVDAVGHNPALKLVLAIVTIALAAASYRFIERPVLIFAGRMRGRGILNQLRLQA